MWAGPLSNWVKACDLILGMDVETVVPGHGPVTDKAGVAQVRDYLSFVEVEATARHDGRHVRLGGGPRHRARASSASGASGDASRSTWPRSTARSIRTYRSPDVVEMFRRIAALER